MQTVILVIHDILRWVLLILLFLSLIKCFLGWQNKRAFSATDKKLLLFTLITTHLNFLVGLFLLFFGRYGIVNPGLPEGVNIMKDGFYRFYVIEHPVGMLVAIILITLGNGVSKKAFSDILKFKKAFWFLLIALVIILAMIPWPFRGIIGRPLI